MRICRVCKNKLSKKNFYLSSAIRCKECIKKQSKINARNITKQCKVCKKNFGTCSSEIKRGGGKFCSRKCLYKWNRNENTYNWKGEKASYVALYKWIYRKLGKPNYCEHCKTTKAKKFSWSNISGKYKRVVSDWQRLCYSCHKKYDLEKMIFIKITCVVCNKVVKTKSRRRKFCSMSCSNKYYRSAEYKKV